MKKTDLCKFKYCNAYHVAFFVPSAFAADEGVEQAILTAKNLLDISGRPICYRRIFAERRGL
ncbi:MAG: hypothetical protein L6V93_08460 [Clostridiales bacterium]|nr:MAG: hypothetical protein L6V93_08460 [Clostridiales bacterium]